MGRELTQAQLEEIFRRSTDDSYTGPLESAGEGEGFDPVAAAAATLERASQAVQRSTQEYYLRPYSTQCDAPASGAVRATGQVTLSRAGSDAAAAITVPAGERLVQSQLNTQGGAVEALPEFELVSDAVLDAGVQTVTADVRAVRAGDQGNVPAGRIVGFSPRGTATVQHTAVAPDLLTDTVSPDKFSEAMIGQYLRITTGTNASATPLRITAVNPVGGGLFTATVAATLVTVATEETANVLEFADLGITVTQSAPTTGGRHGVLDANGRDRNVLRRFEESDFDYRQRIVTLPDVVSPAAIDRICAQILTPVNIPYRILETRQTNLEGMILDLSPLDRGVLCETPESPGINVIPLASPPLPPGTTTEVLDAWAGSVVLSTSDTVRLFIICVGPPNAATAGETGLPYDATNDGVNAYDVGDRGIDGSQQGYESLIAALYDQVDQARGAGVHFEIIQDPDL